MAWHVLPVNDLRQHEETAHCWCAPRIEECVGGDDVIVHNSLDGRERFETDWLH